MRGPGPKWVERNGASSVQAVSGRVGPDHKRTRTEGWPAAVRNRKRAEKLAARKSLPQRIREPT
jgi:hypothetical protein